MKLCVRNGRNILFLLVFKAQNSKTRNENKEARKNIIFDLNVTLVVLQFWCLTISCQKKKVHIKLIISLIISYKTFFKKNYYVIRSWCCVASLLFVYLSFFYSCTLVLMLYKSHISSPHFSHRKLHVSCKFIGVQVRLRKLLTVFDAIDSFRCLWCKFNKTHFSKMFRQGRGTQCFDDTPWTNACAHLHSFTIFFTLTTIIIIGSLVKSAFILILLEKYTKKSCCEHWTA